MGNDAETKKPDDGNRAIIIVVASIAALVVIVLVVGAIVRGAEQRAHDDQIDNMVNDRLNSCFDGGDC